MIREACRAALCVAGLLAATGALSNGAWAKAPAPLVPIALVEDVTSTTADIEFMDYVGTGQIIKLAPKDTLVLSYLKSCTHETITGGTVRVGSEQSEIEGGRVARTKVKCNGGNMQLASADANASGASAFRLQSAAISPVLYATPPMVQIPRLQPSDDRTLLIERIDRPGERLEVAVASDLASGSFLDLAKTDLKPLAKGGVYRATLGTSKVTFKIDAKAKVAKSDAKAAAKPKGKIKTQNVPVVSRLLRFPPG